MVSKQEISENEMNHIRYYKAREVSSILRIRLNKVYEYLDSGKLNGFKVGDKNNKRSHWRIPESSLNEFTKLLNQE